MEKEVSYRHTNTYFTQNNLEKKTKNIWLVCHGLGYLSKYFIRYFAALNSEENYIIAPQAPSKYYQDRKFRYVGASWLTRENTTMETQNVLRYLQAVSLEENLKDHSEKLVVLGYSQGVSVALRWLAHYQIPCKAVVIHSGGIPKELSSEAFAYLPKKTKVYQVYGNKDEYLNEERKLQEQTRAEELFADKVTQISFKGKHEVHVPTLQKISGSLSLK